MAARGKECTSLFSRTPRACGKVARRAARNDCRAAAVGKSLSTEFPIRDVGRVVRQRRRNRDKRSKKSFAAMTETNAKLKSACALGKGV
eukprot:81407-Pleurochrysis_carterae.AAC.2